MISGGTIMLTFSRIEKSTIPKNKAATYPAARPNKTERALKYPFAKSPKTKHERREIVPTIRFGAEAKSAALVPPGKCSRTDRKQGKTDCSNDDGGNNRRNEF